MKHTIFRLSAGALLFGSIGLAILPQLTSHISSAAVVNAPLVSIYAPFDGTINKASLRAAYPIKTGDLIASLENTRSQSLNLRSLKSQLSATYGEISGIETQRRRLADMNVKLTATREAHLAARIDWFGARLLEAEADVMGAAAELEFSEDKLNRFEVLRRKGGASQSELVAAKADLLSAQANHRRQLATVQRLELERDYLSDGEVVDLDADGMDQFNYRINDNQLRDAELGTRLLTLQTRRAALKAEISGLELEKERNEKFSPTSQTDGIIWEASSQVGSNVTEGEQVAQILDCSRRFLEVMVNERFFETIEAGDKVSVMLKGASENFDAAVYAVYGSGARPNRNMQAAQQRIETPTGLRVIVVMGKVDVSDPAVAKGFCDVGRAAEVHFAMKAGTKFDFYINQIKTFFSDRIKFAGAEKVDVANLVIEN